MHSSGLTTSPSRAVSSHTIHFLRTWSLTSARSFSGSPPRRDHSSQHLSWQMVETKREPCFLCNVIFCTRNYQHCLVSLASLSYLAAPPKPAPGRKAPNTVQLPKSVSDQWWSHSLDPKQHLSQWEAVVGKQVYDPTREGCITWSDNRISISLISDISLDFVSWNLPPNLLNVLVCTCNL